MPKPSFTNTTTLFCFSPPVMLVTLILEFSFALYVAVTAKRERSSLLIALLLICLGIFQLSEYQVCDGERTLAWMRVGYAAICLLPAIGIHLVTLATKQRWLRYAAYAAAAVFVGYFLTSTGSIHATVCAGNYVLIDTSGVSAAAYFPYYYFALLGVTIVEIIRYARTSRAKDRHERLSRTMLWRLLVGYATFLIPTGAVYLLSPTARAAIPSIMCGFAVLLALVLTFGVYPICSELEI